MSITIEETPRRCRYNGIELPAPPGMSPRDVGDLHSAIYPELICAEIIIADELVNGVQEITFRGNELARVHHADRSDGGGQHDRQRCRHQPRTRQASPQPHCGVLAALCQHLQQQPI